MLTTKLRTHKVLIKDEKIAITQEQYDTLKTAKFRGKATDLIEVRDPDTNRLIFNGELREIKEFFEIERGNMDGMQWICDFGVRHDMNEQCNCYDTYKVRPWEYRYKCHKMFAGKHRNNFTEQERRLVLADCNTF